MNEESAGDDLQSQRRRIRGEVFERLVSSFGGFLVLSGEEMCDRDGHPLRFGERAERVKALRSVAGRDQFVYMAAYGVAAVRRVGELSR